MNEISRNIAIVTEIENSVKYLRNGLAEIQKITAANNFYDPPLIYLSGGFERLFKSMLCLNFKEVNGRLPRTNEIWNRKNGHNIDFLKDKIEGICIPIDLPFAKDDYKIITSDKTIKEICEVLTAYGSRARYFNLDIILGNEQKFDAKNKWEKIEDSLLKEYYGEKKFYRMFKKTNSLEVIYEKTSELLVSKLEVFLRAITRQFIFGNFSSESNQYVFSIESFTDIDDNQIGKTDYRQLQNHEFIKREPVIDSSLISIIKEKFRSLL
ncbi:hypothetical protein EO244_03065 [Ancylomarina salipaludis]|uniref:Uncharacterized protein n=1 Tax=Ancylomarina salipaludis TaxID=2501299 RepID=A0A4Q1JQR6_9BACT|nr:hypothetical protein [Ancylomarina salipaludis]RXQ96621.1 hypothetical protein EO244_03065 [Ancylomarina salipaludis]